MIKKLMPFICLTAALLLSAPALAAEETAESAMYESTFGRFKGDVDNIFDINDWSTVEYSRWFSYIKTQPVTGPWDMGLALELSKIHLGLFYKGTFNDGTNADGSITIGPDGQTGLAPDLDISDPSWSPPIFASNSGIARDNYYKVLIGAGKNSFMLTLSDTLTSNELPHVFAGSDIDVNIDGRDYSIPAGSNGSYRERNGTINPELYWGASEDIQLGKYAARPKAWTGIAVNFDDVELVMNTPDGDTVTIRHDNGSSSLVPTLGADTGKITIWSGDWGTFRIGAVEQFSIKIENEGSGGPLAWENRIQPYAVFSYNPVEYFGLAARLDVPIWFGSSGGTGNFIGVGAKGNGAWGADVSGPGSLAADATTLQLGFRLKGTILDKEGDKTGLLSKLSLNCGVQVNLPRYLYSGTFTDDPDNNEYTTDYTHEWTRPAPIQEVRWGITFNITPNVVFDTYSSVDFSRGFNIFQDRLPPLTLMLSVKHNGPKRAVEQPRVEQPNPDANTTE